MKLAEDNTFNRSEFTQPIYLPPVAPITVCGGFIPRLFNLAYNGWVKGFVIFVCQFKKVGIGVRKYFRVYPKFIGRIEIKINFVRCSDRELVIVGKRSVIAFVYK